MIFPGGKSDIVGCLKASADKLGGSINRKRYILLNGAVLGIAAVVASTWREIAIDRCLDNGGSLNYRDSKCEK